MGVRLGHEVGYATESEDCSSTETILKYMTDAAHLREAALQPDLASYTVIMLDQAHERPRDDLFRLARTIVGSRPSLKLLIASSTIEDVSRFSVYLGTPIPVFGFPGTGDWVPRISSQAW
ncbi:hypothetical protein L7F22_022222 [Adiantum nelumboides]|nr:hypothetical protein [Adiantum nelumboides]